MCITLRNARDELILSHLASAVFCLEIPLPQQNSEQTKFKRKISSTTVDDLQAKNGNIRMHALDDPHFRISH